MSLPQRLPHQVKMSPHYFLRKLTYLTQLPHPPSQVPLITSQKQTLLLNFKHHFQHYSQHPQVVNSFMLYAFRSRIPDIPLWTLYADFVLSKWDKFTIHELTHITNMLVKYHLPTNFLHKLEQTALKQLHQMTTQEIAMVCKHTKGTDLLRKVNNEHKLQVTNDIDLYFFTSAYVKKRDQFRDVVENLKEKLKEMMPEMKNATRICQILREYSEERENLPVDVIKLVENAILSDSMQLNQGDIDEILLTLYSKQYHSSISSDFWPKFASKIASNISHYRINRLLSIFATRNFPNSTILQASFPILMTNIDKTHKKSTFRDSFCSITRYPDVPSDIQDWCLSQTVYFRQQLDGFDIATMLRAAVGPGWYNPVLWSVLLDRFYSQFISPPSDIDKSMVYFAVKSMEIDKIQIPNLPMLQAEKMQKYREIYRKLRFHRNANWVHVEVGKALKELGVKHKEFEPVVEIYAPDFVLTEEKVVIQCFEWRNYVIAGSKRMNVGMEMMVRHLTTSGWSVLLVSTASDLPHHLTTTLSHLRTCQRATVLHIT